MLIFSVLGGIDRILGNRFGLGREFEKGFMLLGSMSLSMIGMIVISPFIADLLAPMFNFAADVLHMEPSIIPASLFSNDMGGAPLSVEAARDAELGMFNGLVVSTMMGCTISFTIPCALSMVKKERHGDVLLGFLCGIVTIPVGCFFAGLMRRIPVLTLVLDLLPLIIFSAVIAVGLILCPNVCVKIFGVFGVFIKILITVGLVLGIMRYLTGIEIIKGLETYEEGASICFNACAVMSGAFPLLHIISKLISKPLSKLGKIAGINETSALGFVASVATSLTTFEMMNEMDSKGIILNAAFAISAAFTFAGALAFTMAFNADYIFPVIVGKLISGAAALAVAVPVAKRNMKNKKHCA